MADADAFAVIHAPPQSARWGLSGAAADDALAAVGYNLSTAEAQHLLLRLAQARLLERRDGAGCRVVIPMRSADWVQPPSLYMGWETWGYEKQRTVLNSFHAAGLVVVRTGVRANASRHGRRTDVVLTEHGRDSIDRLLEGELELIRLRPRGQVLQFGTSQDREKRDLIRLPINARTREMQRRLDAANALIRQSTYSVEASRGETDRRGVEREKEREGLVPRYQYGDGSQNSPMHDECFRLELPTEDFVLDRHLFDARPDRYGRFHSCFQSAPKELRRRLLIDGSPVVEFDFSGTQLAILYHLQGLDTEGDLYALPGVGGEYRAALKKAHLIAINTRSKAHAMSTIRYNSESYRRALVRGDEIPEDGLLLPDGMSPRDLVEAIAARHRGIGGGLFSGRGLELMFLESRIAEGVLAEFSSRGTAPVLPWHDGFVTTLASADALFEAMVRSWQSVLGAGRVPTIKRLLGDESISIDARVVAPHLLHPLNKTACG